MFVLAAGLRQRDFRRIEIAPRQCTLLKKFLAAFVELLLRIKGRLRRGGIEFRLLDLLWKTGIHGGDVGGLRLFEIALGGFHRGGQILVLQNGEQLSFFHAAPALHQELSDRRSDFGRDGSLLQRIDDPFGRNGLRNRSAPRRCDLHRDERLLFLLGLVAAVRKKWRAHNARAQKRGAAPPMDSRTDNQLHGVVSTPVRVCRFASATR